MRSKKELLSNLYKTDNICDIMVITDSKSWTEKEQLSHFEEWGHTFSDDLKNLYNKKLKTNLTFEPLPEDYKKASKHDNDDT